MLKYFIPLLLSVCISCSESQSDTDWNPSFKLKVYPCDSDSINISINAKTALTEAGFDKCIMPFGVLIGADQDMPIKYLEMAGKIVAELLDQDMDGAVDDTAFISYVQDWKTAWLAMPMDNEKWESEQLPILSVHLGYDIIIPKWWMGSLVSELPSTHARAVMVEEVVHFLTQFGYSAQYPNQFGVDNWESTIAQETLLAQCEWWQHPENQCPDNPPEIDGDCSDPNCDVVEFYQQVLILRAGMQPGWFGIGFPHESEGLEALLSQSIKTIMDDPTYFQLKSPLTFNYLLNN